MIFKKFRGYGGDPHYEVLLRALRRYDVPIRSWMQYAICIDYTKDGQLHQRLLYPEEKPLAVLKEMQMKGTNPQLMLKKYNDASIRLREPSLRKEPSMATSYAAPTSRYVTSSSFPAPHKPDKLLWHAVSTSSFVPQDRSPLSGHRLVYRSGDTFDIIGHSGPPANLWLATPYNRASSQVGLIESANFLEVPLSSKTSDYIRSRVCRLDVQSTLALGTVRVYAKQNPNYGLASSHVSTIFVMGILKNTEDHRDVSFRAVGHTDCHPEFDIYIYPQQERHHVLCGLMAYVDMTLESIEIVQGKDVRDEWNDLSKWLPVV